GSGERRGREQRWWVAARTLSGMLALVERRIFLRGQHRSAAHRDLERSQIRERDWLWRWKRLNGTRAERHGGWRDPGQRFDTEDRIHLEHATVFHDDPLHERIILAGLSRP